MDKFARLSALKPARPAPTKAELRTPNEADAIARVLGAGVATNHYGEHLCIRNWFSTPEFHAPRRGAISLLARAPGAQTTRRGEKRAKGEIAEALHDPEKWLFLDTETTGLAGGTGTYAFLVGIAWWDAGGLQVEQMFLRDFSEEHSLLAELSARLAERPVLVTFNGKSFDWPLLENRYRMTRAIAVPKLAGHLDLLHPARALWRLRLGSVRLVELERHVLDAERLGWQREDDVASALIPQFYFDYLRGGTAQPLAGVVKHNQMDLRGLAALYAKIDGLLEESGANGSDEESLDLFGLSRYLNRRGEEERAQEACRKALGAGLPAEYRPVATRELAQMAKRRGDAASAAELWTQLVGDPQDGITACEQLAMHYERKEKEYGKALEYAELGLAKLRRVRVPLRDPYAAARVVRWEERLMRRAERLRHRMKTGQGRGRLLAAAGG